MKKVQKQDYVDAQCLSWESFRRFVAISISRSQILQGEKFLVPLADFVNHQSLDAPTVYTDYHSITDDGCFEVKADHDIDADSQIFESYGSLDNSAFLVYFGFVPKDNQENCVMIKSPPVHPDLDVVVKKYTPPEWYEMTNEFCISPDFSMQAEHRFEFNERVLLASLDSYGREGCLEESKMHSRRDDFLNHCWTYREERRSNLVLSEAALAALRENPTTLEEDQKLLEMNALSGNTRMMNIIRYRMVDKKILTGFIAYKLTA